MPDLNLPNLVYDKMPTPTLSGAILSDISGSQFATVLTGSAIVRPTDTTAYTLGDLVANSTAFASVTPVSFANAASSAAGVGKIGRLLFKKSGTNVTNAQFRVHFLVQIQYPLAVITLL